MNYLNLYVETLNSLPFFLPLIFAGLLGSMIGSFLNVVIFRHGTEENINGRSHCQKCDYKLHWYDLVPVFSWLSLRGHCRKCDKKISIQYPLVEMATAILFVFIFKFSFSLNVTPSTSAFVFVWNAIMFSILTAIFVYDFKHKIIPNKWSYTFVILALVQTLWLTPFGQLFGAGGNTESILNLFSGIILFTPFFLLWLVSGGRWIGLGDAKLAIGIGWFLGFVHGLSAIVLGFWIGAVVAILMIFIEHIVNRISGEDAKGLNMKSEIPFGPFLIAGILIQFFFPVDVIGLSIFFM